MSDVATVAAILAATVALFVWNRLPVVVVALGSALALHLSGLLTLTQSLSGFGDPVVVFVAALFVVTEGLEATGVTAWIGERCDALAAGSPARLMAIAMLGVAALCPLINATGAVGALLPVILIQASRQGAAPSRFLMPMAFAAGAGSHLALTGAPKNVLIADAVSDAGAGMISFFDFAYVGLPLLAGTFAVVFLFGARLTPERRAAMLPPDFSRYAETLVADYNLASDVFRLKLRRNSPLCGRGLEAVAALGREGLNLVTATDRSGALRLGAPLAPGDRLLVRGSAEAAAGFAAEYGLKVEAVSGDTAARALFNRMSGVVETVIAPRSRFVGRRVFPGMVAPEGDLVVVAVKRQGEDLEGDIVLAPGDHLLIQGGWDAFDRRRGAGEAEFLVVADPVQVRRQTVALGAGVWSMLAIAGGMAALIAFGVAAPAVAALFAAAATLALRIVTPEEAYRAINWTTVILMAGMFPLSTALYETGAARLAAERLVEVIGAGSPRLLLFGLFWLGAGLGAVVSNTATCMILIPIATLAAEAFGVSPAPALMTLSVATSASFLTPVSTPVNAMVMGPAGYRFGDYWRLGLPLTLVYMAVAVWLTPLVWPF